MTTYNLTNGSPVLTGVLATAPTHMVVSGNFKGSTLVVKARYSTDTDYAAVLKEDGTTRGLEGEGAVALSFANGVDIQFQLVAAAQDVVADVRIELPGV